MKRTMLLTVALAALAGGCQEGDPTARMLIEPARLPGQFLEVCSGTRTHLLNSGRIDAHRRVEVDPNTHIDCWLIKSRLVDETADNAGSLLETRLTRGTWVMLHPLLAGKAWFLPLGEQLARRGWDVILLDLRGHGFSDGRYTTWGAREKRDVRAVVDRLVRDEAISDRIYVCGSSLGAAVALQYAAIEPRCQGVVALSPPMDATAVCRRMLCLLTESQFDRALRRATELADWDPAEASCLAAAQNIHCPVMLVHGAWDLLVPISHSEAIFDAVESPKKLVRMKWAGHVLELGRGRWLADQMDAVAAMEGERRPQLIALRVLSEPGRDILTVRRSDYGGPAGDVVIPRLQRPLPDMSISQAN